MADFGSQRGDFKKKLEKILNFMNVKVVARMSFLLITPPPVPNRALASGDGWSPIFLMFVFA